MSKRHIKTELPTNSQKCCSVAKISELKYNMPRPRCHSPVLAPYIFHLLFDLEKILIDRKFFQIIS